MGRRSFFKFIGAGVLLSPGFARGDRPTGPGRRLSEIFHVDEIPDPPFLDDGQSHMGVEALLALLDNWRLPFHHSPLPGDLAGPNGLIAADDVVLIKVNAQWKCRGCTNSDVQANALVASRDPVALDYWAAKHVLHPIDGNPRHHPDHENIRRWLDAARETINVRGGLFPPERGGMRREVTDDESRMAVVSMSAAEALRGRALPRP